MFLWPSLDRTYFSYFTLYNFQPFTDSRIDNTNTNTHNQTSMARTAPQISER